MSKKDFVKEPLPKGFVKALLSEHKRLIKILEKGNKDDLKKEAKKQKKELKKYKP